MSGSANLHAKLAPSALERTMKCHASVHLTEKFYDDVVVDSLRGYKYLLPYLVKEVPAEEWSKSERKVIPIVRKIFKLAAGHEGTPKERTVWHEEIKKLSPTMKKLIEQNSGSVAAREGTRAHDFAEKILIGEMSPEDLPDDFYDGVMMYVDHCLDLHHKDPDDVQRVELVIPIFYDSQSTCTADYVKILGDRDRIIIRDLKYGKGKYVVAERNPQLTTYALSVAKYLEQEDEFALHPGTIIDVGIVQPRNNEGPSHIRNWEMSYRDLAKYGEEIQAEAQAIFGGSMKFGPSDDACRWCPVKNLCEKKYDAVYEQLPGGKPEASKFFSALPNYKDHAKSEAKYKALPPMERASIQGFDTMEVDDLVKLWKVRKQLVNMATDLDDYLKFLVEGGLEHEELKLVDGRAPNPFIGDKEAFAAFLLDQGYEKEEVYKTEVVGITQARKLFGEAIKPLVKNKNSGIFDEELKEQFESYLSRQEATPSLAHSSDKRKPVKKKVDFFKNLDEDLGDEDGKPAPPKNIT